MKEVAVNYTVYIKDMKEVEEYVKYIKIYHYEAMEQLDYTIKRVSYGIHRNASRYHIHYHSINVIPDNVKIYKILNAKIKSLKINSLFPYQEFTPPEIKMSYHYEFVEEDVLMYPLKEYENNKIMNLDINIEYIYNITDIHLEDLRAEANKRYQKAMKEHEKKELMKMEKTQHKKDLYSYLDKIIYYAEIPEGSVNSVVVYTIKNVLKYYKENKKNFSIHQLKNVAVNYLYFKDIITELNIIEYINL